MAEDDKSKNDTFRWAVGALIGLLAAGGGIAAIYNIIHPPNPNDNRNSIAVIPSSPSPTVKPGPSVPQIPETKCQLKGYVFKADKTPINNAEIVLIDANKKEFSLNRTGNDGRFEANCSYIPASEFPLTLRVRKKEDLWNYDYSSLIQQGEQTGINVYVPGAVLIQGETNKKNQHRAL